MTVNVDELRSLSPAEKLRLIEILWDDLGESITPIPLPDWVDQEAMRRREELRRDPSLGLGHQEVWQRIDRRNGWWHGRLARPCCDARGPRADKLPMLPDRRRAGEK